MISADFNQLTESKFKDVVRFSVDQEQGSEDMYVYFLPKEELTAEERAELFLSIKDYAKILMFGAVRVHIDEFTLVPVSFNLEITLGTNTSNTANIEQQIETIIKRYLDRDTQEPCMTMKRSAVIAQLEDQIQEIENVTVKAPISDSKVKENQCFQLYSLEINFVQKDN